jgi:hypothetical protein
MNEATVSRFVVFCLEAYKRANDLSGIAAVKIFLRYGIVDYLRDGYDALHSLGELALIDDITDYIAHRG